MESYTADQVIRMLGVNPRTLHKWMIALQIEFEIPGFDERLRRLTQEQVDQLAHYSGRVVQPLSSERELRVMMVQLRKENELLRSQLGDALRRLEEVNLRLVALDRGSDQGDDKPRVLRVSSIEPREHVVQGLPIGLVSLNGFCEAHQLTVNTIKGAIKRGELACHRGSWRVGSTLVGYALDEQEQAAILEKYT